MAFRAPGIVYEEHLHFQPDGVSKNMNRSSNSISSKIFPVIIALLLLAVTAIAGQEVSPEVASVLQKLNSMRSFKATVSIEQPAGGTARGELSYQHGKIHIKLNDGRVIASNGRQLIVFSPDTGVGGKQDLDPEATIVGGPGWLTHGFTTQVVGNSAHLKAINENAFIEEVKLSWVKEFQLTTLSIKNKNADGWLKISLSNIRNVESFPPGLFSYKPPPGTRTVENPLNQSN